MQTTYVKFKLVVQEDGADKEQVDDLIISLVDILRDSESHSIEFGHGDNVPGAKGDPLTTGAIILTIAVASIPSLIALLQDWVSGRRKVTVEAPNGAKVEFVPNRKYSEEEIISFVKKLNELPKSQE